MSAEIWKARNVSHADGSRSLEDTKASIDKIAAIFVDNVAYLAESERALCERQYSAKAVSMFAALVRETKA